MIAQDIKPNMVTALDSKPNNAVVLDVKTNFAGIDTRTEKLYSVTTNANQSMGLLLSLTYKEGFTVNSPYSR